MLEQLHIEDNEEECGGQPAGKVKKSITQREAGQHMLRGSQRICISRTSRRDSNIPSSYLKSSLLTAPYLLNLLIIVVIIRELIEKEY